MASETGLRLHRLVIDLNLYVAWVEQKPRPGVHAVIELISLPVALRGEDATSSSKGTRTWKDATAYEPS